MQEQIEATRSLLSELEFPGDWEAAVDPSMPPHLARLHNALVDAYRRADVEWIVEHTHAELEMIQPPELPGARSYHGQAGLLEAMLDWPLEWEGFEVEPVRVFAANDEQVVIVVIHLGRPPSMEIEVEQEFTWMMCWRDEKLTRWDMFMTVDEALRAAG